jgi:hypothetical protein
MAEVFVLGHACLRNGQRYRNSRLSGGRDSNRYVDAAYNFLIGGRESSERVRKPGWGAATSISPIFSDLETKRDP